MHGERKSGRFRQYASGLMILSCLLGSTLLGTGTAYADAYRYWGFHQSNGGDWAFSEKGPAQVTPKDGDVDGWRYAIAGDSTGDRVPRTAVTFDELCGGAPEAKGMKRVGIVIDFGLPDEAPDGEQPPPVRGQCAIVDTEATSAQVLATVAHGVREQKGLVCGIDAYPRSGCGDPVADEPSVPTPEPTVELQLPEAAPSKPTSQAADEPAATATAIAVRRDGEGGGFPVMPVVGGAIVVLLIGAGVWQYNRRRGSAS